MLNTAKSGANVTNTELWALAEGQREPADKFDTPKRDNTTDERMYELVFISDNFKTIKVNRPILADAVVCAACGWTSGMAAGQQITSTMSLLE